VTDWPDDVKRVKDAMDLHAVTGDHGYAVFRLATGEPVTRDAYPSRADARRMAERKTRDPLLILEIQPDGMPPNEAAAVLKYERTLRDMGWRTPDTLETEQNSGILSMPRTRHDRKRMAAQLIKGTPLYDPATPYGNLPHFLRRH
jgi:hypothetical protein